MGTPNENAALLMSIGAPILPVGAAGTVPYAQTFDRAYCNGSAVTPATGVMNMTAIWLPQGAVVTGITFVVIGGPTTSTHLWAALYRSDLGTTSPLMAQSTDDVTSTDSPANTAFRRTLATPQTCPYTGLYYIGWMQTSSGQNTLMCAVSQSVNGNGNIAGMTPVLAFTHATTGLTTTAPATLLATTAVITSRIYAFVD
jgi:hypothetical protein